MERPKAFFHAALAGLASLGSITCSGLEIPPTSPLPQIEVESSIDYDRYLYESPLPYTPPKSPLEEYLESIEEERISTRATLEQFHRFPVGLYILSQQKFLENFDIYFPLWKAAEIQSGVPWELTSVLHADETTTSEEKYPQASGHIGAMQLTLENTLKPEIITASEGWEFLDELPQRYSQKMGWPTNDWEDILRGAYFIRWVAQWGETPEEDEAKLLGVVKYKYSAVEHGIRRADSYYQLKELIYSR